MQEQQPSAEAVQVLVDFKHIYGSFGKEFSFTKRLAAANLILSLAYGKKMEELPEEDAC